MSILTFIEILIAFTFIVIVTRFIDNKILNNRVPCQINARDFILEKHR